jgi:hypothetical protein
LAGHARQPYPVLGCWDCEGVLCPLWQPIAFLVHLGRQRVLYCRAWPALMA